MKKLTKRSEVWREVARQLIEEPEKLQFGICYMAVKVAQANGLSADIHQYTLPVLLWLPDDNPIYAYPVGTEHEARSLAALWMMEECLEIEQLEKSTHLATGYRT